MKSTKAAVSSGDMRLRVWHNRTYGFEVAKYMMMGEMRLSLTGLSVTYTI